MYRVKKSKSHWVKQGAVGQIWRSDGWGDQEGEIRQWARGQTNAIIRCQHQELG